MTKNVTLSPLSTFSLYCSIAALAAAILAIVLHLTQSDLTKIVYIDSPKLLAGYKGMATARKEYESRVAVLNTNLDSLSKEYQMEVERYKASKSKMSSRELSLTEELLEAKRTQLIGYEQAVSEKMKQQEQEITTKVVTYVNEFIKHYAQNKGYRFVLSANQFGGLAYAEEGTDITDDVLKQLNEALENGK